MLEVLSHISSGNKNANGGGLAFASDVDGLSPTTIFRQVLSAYSVIELTLLVTSIYLRFWRSAIACFGGEYFWHRAFISMCTETHTSWVDLDAKRLEPWFQLSSNNGATAEDSLLLQYPFEFLPFIPITAFRRK